jgi:two-component system, NtrC family, nitrogen regulation response regulator NtrX
MKGNLLIVDDEVDLSVNMKELLEDEARDIFIANNGQEGLEILKSQKIDVVISDVKMPVMDGLKLIQEARKIGLNMPFIFYTGHGSAELRRLVQELGATDLLTKPNFLNLELAVRTAMPQ